MKKTLITLSLVAVSLAALGQGKLSVNNDNHLIFLDASTALVIPADIGLAGLALPADVSGLPSGKNLVFGLYAGSSAGSLQLLTTFPANDGFGISDGGIDGGSITVSILNGFPMDLPGGVASFFQAKVWDGFYATPELQAAANVQDYFGQSLVFQVTPTSGSSPPANIDFGSATTWAPANIVISAAPVPEPSAFALAGLGAAAMLIFRRRK